MRRKIGVIVDNLYEYQWNILSGIFDSAEKFNLDIFCFTGKTLNTPSLNELQANLIYNLPKKENVNGLIIFTSAIGSNTSSENLINFCKKYSKEIPTVSIGTVIEEIPSITIDNVSGFKEVLIHLIEDHALKDFAFISGPLQNLEAQIRFNTFLEIMKKYKLEINEEKIYYGDFLLNSGKEAIKTFLDKRKIKFEVLVCANDDMAIGATEELKRRGYLIPEDIKITGFDDIPEANFLTPPLTTVHQPLYEMGWKSVEILTEMIEGKKVTDNVILPTKLVIRDSCGCRYSGIERAKLELTQENLLIELEKLKLLKDNFLDYVINNLNMDGIFQEELEKLYFSLIDSLIQKDSTIFLKTLETLLKISEIQKRNTTIYQDYISLLRKFLYFYLDKKDLLSVENLFHQARVIISDISTRTQGYEKFRTERQAELIAYTGINLISSFNIEELINQTKTHIPNLGISSFYIVCYEEKYPPFKKGKLLTGYNRGLSYEKSDYFKIDDLIPKEYLPPHRFTYIVEPLFYKENSFGYLLLELGPNYGIIYETLRAQISAAIQGAILFKEKEEYAQKLEKHIEELDLLNQVGRNITSNLNLETLWETVIEDLIKLVDYSYLYIILASPGQGKEFQIKTKRYKEVPKDKFTNTEKRYILESIKEKKVIIKNNLRGKIKSFLSVPIIFGNEVIGSIVVKNYNPNSYNEYTIKLLSNLSNFIAVAVKNAKLFEETEKLATTDALTGVLNRRTLEESFYKEVERTRRYLKPLSVIVIDVDDFKLFNDTYGHIFGDQVLKEIASLIKYSCRKVDIVGRYGGDEFTIILPETPLKGAVKVAERLLKNIRAKAILTPNNTQVPIRVSIGIASYPEDTNDPEKLLTLADTAMYKAKVSGGDSYAIISFEPPLSQEQPPKFDVFLGLINAIDNKDNYTFLHSQDVSKYAVKLGEKLGLSKEDLEILELAGKLHDIGKIGIPSEILKKPGPLTEEEWKIIKEHPRLSYLILNQIPRMEKLLQTVLYHHERYDGKGYPQNLQGKDIPILARILSVVDAYSAMRSDRPYRKAMSKKEIINEFKKNMGKQFDPEITQKFIELLEKGDIE